jgi:hypothetical protein
MDFDKDQPSLLAGLVDHEVLEAPEPVNPREEIAPEAPPVSPWREIPPWSIPERPQMCGSCALKGYIRQVVLNSNGGVTALCQTHTRMEQDLRQAFRAANNLQPLTAERAREIRNQVFSRYRRPAA